MLYKITTIEDVRLFIHLIINEGVNYHPDDDFEIYENTSTGEATYTTDEAVLRNLLNGQCFEVCKSEGVDIYEFSNNIFLQVTGLDKYIPKSTGDL